MALSLSNTELRTLLEVGVTAELRDQITRVLAGGATAARRKADNRPVPIGSKGHTRCQHHERVPEGSTLTTRVLCFGPCVVEGPKIGTKRSAIGILPPRELEARLRFVAAIDKAVLARRKAWAKRPAPIVTAAARKAKPTGIPRSELHVHSRGCWIWVEPTSDQERATGSLMVYGTTPRAATRTAPGAGIQVCRHTGGPHPDERRRAARRRKTAQAEAEAAAA